MVLSNFWKNTEDQAWLVSAASSFLNHLYLKRYKGGKCQAGKKQKIPHSKKQPVLLTGRAEKGMQQ